jgi:hypothetical protein
MSAGSQFKVQKSQRIEMTGVQRRDNPLLGFKSRAERVLADDPFLDGLISYQVLLDDALASFRGHFAIPYAFWINEHPWAFAANAKAGSLGSQDRNSKLFDAILQNFPCLKPMAFGAAIRSHAEEKMALRGIDAHFGKTGIGWIHSELRYKEALGSCRDYAGAAAGRPPDGNSGLIGD